MALDRAKLNFYIPLFIDIETHGFEVAVVELHLLPSGKVRPRAVDRLLEQLLDIEMDCFIQTFPDFIQHSQYPDLVAVAGTEVISIAVCNAGVYHGPLDIRPAFVRLHQDQKVRLRHGGDQAPVI